MYGIYGLGTGPQLLKVNPDYYLPAYSNKTNSKDTTFAIPSGYQIISIKFDQRVMMNDCSHQLAEQNKNI